MYCPSIHESLPCSTTATASSPCGDGTDYAVSRSRQDRFKNAWLIRGLPGAGKTTVAEKLAAALRTEAWFEADDYFYGADSNAGAVYRFNPAHIEEAHAQCQKNFLRALLDGEDNIIVSNTFTRNWELAFYVNAAKEYNYVVHVLHVEGDHGSVHGVPTPTIDKMKSRWESYDVQAIHARGAVRQ